MKFLTPERGRRFRSSSRAPSRDDDKQTRRATRKEIRQEIQRMDFDNATPAEAINSLPFPFNQQTFCRYEPIEKRIDSVRVLIVDNLLRDETDISEVARAEWGKDVSVHLKRERQIAEMALQNIASNLVRL